MGDLLEGSLPTATGESIDEVAAEATGVPTLNPWL